jgi:hypothetical protein
MASDPMNTGGRNQHPLQFQNARRCGARTKSGKPCRSPATTKGCCRLHGGARGSGGPPGECNGQYRHGERTKAAIAERQKFSASLKMPRWHDLDGVPLGRWPAPPRLRHGAGIGPVHKRHSTCLRDNRSLRGCVAVLVAP